MSSSKRQRTFEPDDQERFATLSGDRNPMHMDPIAARRTQAGLPAVHGIHILLWALDSLVSRHRDLPLPTSIRVDFKSFLAVGKLAILGELSGSLSRRATVTVDGVTILALELRFGSPTAVQPALPCAVKDATPAAPEEAVVLDLADVEGRLGAVAFAAGPEAVQVMFPHASAWLDPIRVSGLLCCTRLVGMVCPGLHSIFNRADLDLVQTAGTAPQIDYVVEGVDPRFRFVKLAVVGGGLSGTLVASLRPAPVQQPDMAAVSALVAPDAFRGSRALVIGGSRGLGELTAKLLAVGGADVLITYARGRLDAERVAAEINAWGGVCRIAPFDAELPAAGQIGDEAAAVTHCYYYATSTIASPSIRLFDKARLDGFIRIYVEAFDDLCKALQAGASREVRVFYPSTVYVSERPVGMVEYSMAKAIGEILCDEINRRAKGVSVVVTRLPRLATDQTAGLVAEEPPSAAEVLRPLIGRVQNPGTGL